MKKRDLSTGIASLFSGCLFLGGSVLIYFGLLHNKNPNIIDGILLWIGVGTFLLGGTYLLIHGITTISYNIFLIKKQLPRPLRNDKEPFINTNPLSGFLALGIGILFTLTIIFFLHPEYKKGAIEFAGLLTFIIFAALLFAYATFIFLYNFIRKNIKN